MLEFQHAPPSPAGGEAGAESAAGDGAGDAGSLGGGYPAGADDYPTGADAGGPQQSGGSGADPFERDLGGDGWDAPDNSGGSGDGWGSFCGDDGGGDALGGGGFAWLGCTQSVTLTLLPCQPYPDLDTSCSAPHMDQHRLLCSLCAGEAS